jgi:nucleoid DNA-binding protein
MIAKSPAAKPAARSSAKKAAKAQPAVAGDAVVIDAEGAGAAPEKDGAVLKLKALLERVTAASGARKKDVRAVVEATLTQLGETLKRGETLILPGLGHMRVVRKASGESQAMTLKLRQGGGGKRKDQSEAEDDKEGLADESDQG